MHKKLRRKLLLSIIMLSVTFITLVSTTFAWFSANRETQFDDFNIKLEGYDGIQISIDGSNFYSKLTADDIKMAAAAKALEVDLSTNSLSNERAASVYETIALKPVTLASLNWNKIDDANESFMELDTQSITDGYFDLKAASSYSYVAFDVWFRVANTGEANRNYELSFTTDKDVAEDANIKASKMSSGKYKTSINTAFDFKGVEYNTGDEFEISQLASIRFGAIVNDGESHILIEPEIGTSSVAIKDDESERFNPVNNLMYQYFNAYAPADLRPISDDKVIEYNKVDMVHDFERAIGRFKANDGKSKYQDIKVSFAIWQEAYDGDYMPGSQTVLEDVVVSLGFKMREVIANEES